MPGRSSLRPSWPNHAVRLAAWLGLTGLMLVLAWLAWDYNLERACVLRQWPELPSCMNRSSEPLAQVQSLQQRIDRNPGDSDAWISLALLSSRLDAPAPGLELDAVLKTATHLAPQDVRLQRLQAARALQHQAWPLAVDWLVRLVRDSDDGQAAVALAMLMQEPGALSAMQGQARQSSRWLAPVINAMAQARVPVVTAMPLVVTALAQHDMPQELTQQIMRQLKTDGQWIDAHVLWTAWLGHPTALMFNGSFDNGFIADGFDWEIMPAPPSKVGAQVLQLALAQHGGVLQVDFTGRTLAAPLVRQQLLLLNDRLAFSGQFMTAGLQAREGLAWVVKCAAGGRELARTPAIKDTARQWLRFYVEFSLPASCGHAAVLELQAFAPHESGTGFRGQATFDDFTLKALP